MVKTIRIAIQAIFLLALTAAFLWAGTAGQPDSVRSAAGIKASVEKAPKAVFPKLKFDFDPVFEGTEIKHDFVVENRGDAPLVIKGIRPD